MFEFSLYVLDITMNSVRAGATNITISLKENSEFLDFSVTDNGCGMTPEQVEKLGNPFFTTRKTRNVGLGIPFLKMLAESTGGYISITSVHESVSEKHGTTTSARFGRNHLDFVPLGDMPDTLKTLIHGSPDIDFLYTHETEVGTVSLSTAEIRQILGEDISLAEPEILMWIESNLREQYESIKK